MYKVSYIPKLPWTVYKIIHAQVSTSVHTLDCLQFHTCSSVYILIHAGATGSPSIFDPFRSFDIVGFFAFSVFDVVGFFGARCSGASRGGLFSVYAIVASSVSPCGKGGTAGAVLEAEAPFSTSDVVASSGCATS